MAITFLMIIRFCCDSLIIIVLIFLVFRKAAKSRNKAIKNKPNSAGSVSAGSAKNVLTPALPQTKSNTRGKKVGVTIPLSWLMSKLHAQILKDRFVF